MQNKIKNKYKAIVMGMSSGGTGLLLKMLPLLPADFSLPIIIVIHVHPDSRNTLPPILDDKSGITVKQADDKERIEPAVAYIAPPGYHLMMEEDMTLSLSIDEPVKYSRPSIDVLFETAADACGKDLIGVIFTGANTDGSDGLRKIQNAGGLAIVQDPETAEADIMPRSAIAATKTYHVLTPEEIVQLLIDLAQEG